MFKNRLYQTVLAGTVALLMTTATFAADATSRPARERRGPGGGPGGGAGGGGMILERVQEAVKELNLNDEQKTKVESILAEARQDFQKMRPELEALDQQDRMKQVGQFLEGVRTDVKAVLTPEQKAILDKKFEEGRQRLRERLGGQGRGEGRGATTRPAGAGGPGAGGRGGPGGPEMMVERLRENLQKLELTDEQKTKVKSLFEELKTKGDELRGQAQSDPGGAREQLRTLMQETREQLRAILTPEQGEKLREMMGPPPGGPRGREGEPGGPRPDGQRKEPPKEKADADKEMQQMQMTDDMKTTAKSESAKVVSDKPLPAGPSPGEAAPQLSLKKLDGSTFQLSALKGRVVVLVFGSYTSPAFRQRVASLEKLENETAGKAQFLVIYTREAHAAGEWEVDRNKLEEISITQPKDAAGRAEMARTAREKLKITVPIALDTMDNEATSAFGAGPTSAYVIARDGTIAARQKWLEPAALRRAIDEAVKAAPATQSAS